MGPTRAVNVFLRESDPESGAVMLPPRPSDLDCYIRTRWRATRERVSNAATTTTPASPAPRGRVAVLVNGETSRLDPEVSFVQHVVAPWALAGFEVVLFLSLQDRRQKTLRGEWHSDRFETLSELDDAAIHDKLHAVADAALHAGAGAAQLHSYELIRRPPLMPSKQTGGPGHSRDVKRFATAWASYPLHLLVHSIVWRDVERFEAGARDAPERGVERLAFDYVIKMRADTGWVRAAPMPDVSPGAVLVKACLAWGGVNDKIALMPRAAAPHWMRLLEQYYDSTLGGYLNSEQYQLLLATRHGIEISATRDFASSDYYHWLDCFAKLYATPDCVQRDVWPEIASRICQRKERTPGAPAKQRTSRRGPSRRTLATAGGSRNGTLA